jgi:hypothetical protein
VPHISEDTITTPVPHQRCETKRGPGRTMHHTRKELAPISEGHPARESEPWWGSQSQQACVMCCSTQCLSAEKTAACHNAVQLQDAASWASCHCGTVLVLRRVSVSL